MACGRSPTSAFSAVTELSTRTEGTRYELIRSFEILRKILKVCCFFLVCSTLDLFLLMVDLVALAAFVALSLPVMKKGGKFKKRRVSNFAFFFFFHTHTGKEKEKGSKRVHALSSTVPSTWKKDDGKGNTQTHTTVGSNPVLEPKVSHLRLFLSSPLSLAYSLSSQSPQKESVGGSFYRLLRRTLWLRYLPAMLSVALSLNLFLSVRRFNLAL